MKNNILGSRGSYSVRLSSKSTSRLSLLGQPKFEISSSIHNNFSNLENDEQLKKFIRLQQRFQARFLRVKNLCGNNPIYKNIESTTKWDNIAFGRIKLCSVPKSGTTFIYRRLNPTLRIIDERQRFSPAYPIKMIVVRDPYARVVSAFFSKLVAHPYWWNINKNDIFPRYRQNASEISLRCGHDLTFPEFIKFIIGIHTPQLKYHDRHFLRMIEVCNVCVDNDMPEFIAKLETIKDDMDYILNSVGTVGDTGHGFTEVEHMARVFLSYKEDKFKNCGPMCPILRRYWWSQQAVGQISKDIAMPLSDIECEKITPDEFAIVAGKAHEKSKGRYDKHKQKLEIMKEIFSHVPVKDKEELRKLLSIECELFGYNDRPDYVFS